jgi:plastocyanin
MVVCVIAVTSALLIACGGDDDDNGSAAAPAVTTESEDAPASGGDAAPQPVNIIDFGYEPAELSATAGSEVTLELTNSGEFPHTFTIDGVADSMEIAPGESATVTFTPSDAGMLTFFCTVHGVASMSGELTVN